MSPETDLRYAVYAYTSFHFSGEAEKYLLGEFGDCPSAIAACRKLVDDFLLSIRKRADTPDALLAEYASSGPEPHIQSADPACEFSAAVYARRRIRELTNRGRPS